MDSYRVKCLRIIIIQPSINPSLDPRYMVGLTLASLLSIKGFRPLAIASERACAKRRSFWSSGDKGVGATAAGIGDTSGTSESGLGVWISAWCRSRLRVLVAVERSDCLADCRSGCRYLDLVLVSAVSKPVCVRERAVWYVVSFPSVSDSSKLD